MGNFDESIQKLTKVTKELNAVSDSLGWILSDREEEIRDTEIELEVWIPKCIHEEAEMTHDYDDFAFRDADEIKLRDVHLRRRHEIGWAKVDSEWQFAYRTRETRSGRDIRSETQDVFCGPLRDAPRLIRIEAMGHIGSLVGEIAQRARRHIRTIEKLEKPVLDAVEKYHREN